MKKKLLSILLVLCMVLSAMPVAFATDEVPGQEAPEETGLPEAVDGVITLTKDMTVPSTAIPTGDATIDLGGYTLTIADGASISTEEGKTLTIENGTITAEKYGITNGVFTPSKNATVTLNDVTMKTSGSALYPSGGASAVNVVKSQITAAGYAIATNAATKNGELINSYNVKITLTDSTLTATNSYRDNCAVIINVPGELKVDNCTITSERQAVIVRGGTASITNSTLQIATPCYDSPNQYIDPEAVWSQGNEVPSAALVVGNHSNSAYEYPASCTLENTKLIAPEGTKAVYAYAMEKEGTRTAALTLKGCDVTGDLYKNDNVQFERYYKINVENNEYGTITIEGNPVYAKEGDTINFQVTPNPGCELHRWSYAKIKDGKTISETFPDYPTFTMPAYDVTVKAEIAQTYLGIDIAETENGTVEAPQTAHYNDTVTVKVTPAEGYMLDSISCGTYSGETVEVTEKDGAYSFTMPNDEVKITATFKLIPGVTVDEKTSADISKDVKEEDTAKIEAVAGKAEVSGVANAADQDKILDAAKDEGVETTENDQVKIDITAKVKATAADLTSETAKALTFSVTPVATITVNGEVKATEVPVTNDMLDSTKKITVKLPIPEGFEPKEIIHVFDDDARELIRDFEIQDGCAVFTISHFSQFIMNGKAHEHTWDEGKVIKEPTDTEKGEKLYTCSTCGDTKTEEIPVVETKGLKLDAEKVSLVVGGTKSLTLTRDPKDATGTPVWKSSNEKVVKVENGKLTATGAGVATVTVTLGGKTATCTVTVTCDGKEQCKYYTDVKVGEWYHAAVDYVTENGIMQGMGNKIYAPDEKLTRAELAQILFNLESDPKNGETKLTFTDVEKDDWFAEAVAWAASNDIVNGFEESDKTHTFRPNQAVTRQDMVTMIARYAKFKGIAQTTGDGWKEFTDYEQVGDWATEAMAWAVEDGLVNGMGNDKLEPAGTAARSQIAQIMMQFNSKYAVK